MNYLKLQTVYEEQMFQVGSGDVILMTTLEDCGILLDYSVFEKVGDYIMICLN